MVRMFHLTVECAEIRVLFSSSSSSRVMARQRDMTRASHVGVCGRPSAGMIDDDGSKYKCDPRRLICLRANTQCTAS